MTAVAYLLGLLLLAYLGTFLVGARTIRGFGLASSVEYVVLGFLFGPVLGLLDRDTIALFDPLTHTAVGWIALLVGLDYGYIGSTRVRLRSGAIGSLLALLTFGALFASIWWLLPHLTAGTLEPRLRSTLAAGVAVACTETTRHSVRWVVERYQADGPLARLFAEIADVEDMIPILASAAIFAFTPTSSQLLPPLVSPLLSLGLGAAMGLVTAALLGREFRLDESWRLLLGSSLLTIGLAVRATMSPLTTLFAMGVALSISSRHRFEIVTMTAPTERAVLLPALLVAGARLDLGTHPLVVRVAIVAVVGRLLAKFFSGLGLRAFIPEARGTRPWMGLGLMSTGGLAMSLGLAFDLRFPGLLGDVVLASAAGATLVGEFIGPPVLRATLQQSGEIAPPSRPA